VDGGDDGARGFTSGSYSLYSVTQKSLPLVKIITTSVRVNTIDRQLDRAKGNYLYAGGENVTNPSNHGTSFHRFSVSLNLLHSGEEMYRWIM
jgi:hypothetical protein